MGDLKLRPKFNILLFLVFATGFAALYVTAERFLIKRTLDEVKSNAAVAMESLAQVSDRTADTAQLARLSRIKSVYQTLEYRIIDASPQTTGGVITELPDLAAQFKASAGLPEISGEYGKGPGRRYYLARPITNSENQVIGVRLVTIGLQFAIHEAEAGLYTLMGSLLALYAFVFIMVNVLLDRLIVRPITQIAATANEISIGNLKLPEIEPESNDEIGLLVVSFNRLRRSTEEAIHLLGR